MLYCRFIKFVQSILKCDKKPVIYLLYKVIKDQRTITGKNTDQILKEIDEDNIFNVNTKKLKKNMKFCEQPVNSNWKIQTIKELTDVKMNKLYVEFEDESNLTMDEIDNIIHFVATS